MDATWGCITTGNHAWQIWGRCDQRLLHEWPRSAESVFQPPLPFPPLRMRMAVGPLDDAAYDNPSRALVLPGIPASAYARVLDFGSGCGRIARQLIQQVPQPGQYVGVDLNRPLVQWCQENLAPRAPQFRFVHHDVYNLGFNPGAGKPRIQPLPTVERGFTLVVAVSVFTHILEHEIRLYLEECSRVMAEDGLLYSTWFLFDKHNFPMMQDDQNALYINTVDPTNAVIVDREWLMTCATNAGLRIVEARPPEMRGYHWVLTMEKEYARGQHAEIPLDVAPRGRMPPPRFDKSPHLLDEPALVASQSPAHANPAWAFWRRRSL